jgi:hypothetical protein
MGVDIKVPQQELPPLTPGSSNPQQSAAMRITNMNNTQTEISRIGGKNIKKGGSYLEVQPTSTSTMNLNPLLAKIATNDVNSQSNSEFDKAAFKGGSKRHRKTRRSTRRSTRRKTRRRKYKKTHRHHR